MARPPASRGLLLPRPALSPRQSAHGLCAPCGVSDAPKRDDASAPVAVLVYKAVNKAAPSKGTARLATLVLRGASAADDEGNVIVGPVPPLQRQPTVPVGRCPFSALVTLLPCRGPRPWTPPLSCTQPLPSSLCGNPSRPNVWAEEVQDTYKRRRRPFGQEVGWLNSGRLFFLS